MIRHIFVGVGAFALGTLFFGPVVGSLLGLGAFALSAAVSSPVPAGGVVAAQPQVIVTPPPVIVTPAPTRSWWPTWFPTLRMPRTLHAVHSSPSASFSTRFTMPGRTTTTSAAPPRHIVRGAPAPRSAPIHLSGLSGRPARPGRR